MEQYIMGNGGITNTPNPYGESKKPIRGHISIGFHLIAISKKVPKRTRISKSPVLFFLVDGYVSFVADKRALRFLLRHHKNGSCQCGDSKAAAFVLRLPDCRIGTLTLHQVELQALLGKVALVLGHQQGSNVHGGHEPQA